MSIRKEIRPDIGSIYHLVVNGRAKRVVLLADGWVINFFAKHEKGVKTEYIDPIVTMQVLSLVKLSTNSVAPGLHKMDTHLRLEDMRAFWNVVNENCRPLALHDWGAQGSVKSADMHGWNGARTWQIAKIAPCRLCVLKIGSRCDHVVWQPQTMR